MKRKHSVSTREKIRIAHLGLKHSEETKRKISEATKRFSRTPEQRLKMSIIAKKIRRSLTPEEKTKRYDMEWRIKLSNKNMGPWPNDKDGIKYQIRRNFRYKLWKQEVLARDGFKCSLCHTTEGLHIHHKIELDSIIIQYEQQLKSYDLEIPILWDINNGITYCNECHNVIHHGHKISWKKKAIHFLKKLNAISDLIPVDLKIELELLLK